MLSRLFSFWRGLDVLLLLAIVLLSSFGLAALYSIGLGKDPQNFLFFQRQFLFFGIGIAMLLLVAFTSYRAFRSTSILIYICACLLLLAVLFFGETIRGTRGWFTIAGFGFQPSELAKLALIIALAKYFSSYTRQINRFRHIIGSGAIAAVPTVLVLVQPDFGSATVLFCIWLGMMLMSGISKKYVIAMAIGVIAIISIFWVGVFKEYQKARILTFLAPTADVQGAGYNVHQALIAIGSGQWLGRGFGYGSQSHLKFLPENQTDFIFAVIAEEMGLVGVLFVLAAWGLLFQRLIKLMRDQREDFALYCILGVALMFLVHLLFNIGGVLGMIPLTGLVLPFMSYGGSALLMACISIGLVQSIKMHGV